MKSLLLTGAAAALLLAAAGPAGAQDDRRVTTLERQVRELRSIVFQGRDTGQPVIVKPEGPDPAVTALQARVDTLEESIRRQNGQLEVLTHDIDQVRQSVAAARDSTAEVRGQLQGLGERLARIEGQMQAMAAAPPPASAPPAPAPAGAVDTRIPPPPPGAAEAQALPVPPSASRLPPPTNNPAASASPQASAGTATEAFRRARLLMNGGDYPAAAEAWQDFITRFPTNPRAPEARYFLGESQFGREAYVDAARAYAEALRGWPMTAWAPDGLVKLAQALQHLNRREQTCSALGEFERRYAARATAEVVERAGATREAARCAASGAPAISPPPPAPRSTTRPARSRTG